jgi:hypothetical protein
LGGQRKRVLKESHRTVEKHCKLLRRAGIVGAVSDACKRETAPSGIHLLFKRPDESMAVCLWDWAHAHCSF